MASSWRQTEDIMPLNTGSAHKRHLPEKQCFTEESY